MYIDNIAKLLRHHTIKSCKGLFCPRIVVKPEQICQTLESRSFFLHSAITGFKYLLYLHILA